MKNKYLFLIFLLASSGILFAQNRNISGLLISDENAEPIALANIINKTTGQRALTNRKGYFRIKVTENDSISFTSVGFDPLVVPGSVLTNQVTDTILLLMHAATYRLRDITIIYSNRKRDSIARAVALIFKNDSLLNNNDRILRRPRGAPNNPNEIMGYTGALTEMYYQFSKEGKDMVHFEEFVTYYREVQLADTRYNKKTIKEITNIPDASLDDFILFCKLDRKFIINATDYDLVKAIKDCGERFKSR